MQGQPAADEWPVLAGQNASYIAKQLAAFKSGARYHPLMANVVRDLERPAMMALGAYYAQVPNND
jgi:cytochrome c553